MVNEKQKIWMTIKGSLDSDQASGDVSDFATEGYYYLDGVTPCLSYCESEVSGMGNTTTTVRIDGERVSVIRLGDVNSMMEFEKGRQKINTYSTPYGELSVRLYTRDVEIAYDADSTMINGLKMDYDLEIAGLASGSNIIEINVSR